MATKPALPVPQRSEAQRPIGSYRWRRRWEGYLFLLPNTVGFLVFTAVPILAALALSFTDFNLIRWNWVGWSNYLWLLRDEVVRQALANTLLLTAFTTPIRVVLSLFLAVLLNNRLRGIVAYRTAFFLPVVSDSVAISFVWVWLLDGNVGLVNYLLRALGLPAAPNWTDSTTWALPAVMLVDLWKNVGFTTLIYLAGLQSIPANLYDAASIDGAGWWQRLRHITVPLVSPTTFFVTTLSLIWSFQSFEIPWSMFGGGPARATTTLGILIYQTGFDARRMGRATALAFLLFALVLVVTLIQGWLQRRSTHYEVE
jgi:multiple sugar transport system permease protein